MTILEAFQTEITIVRTMSKLFTVCAVVAIVGSMTILITIFTDFCSAVLFDMASSITTLTSYFWTNLNSMTSFLAIATVATYGRHLLFYVVNVTLYSTYYLFFKNIFLRSVFEFQNLKSEKFMCILLFFCHLYTLSNTIKYYRRQVYIRCKNNIHICNM